MKMKKMISSLLIAAVVFSMITPAHAANSHADETYVVQYDEAKSTYDDKTNTFDLWFEIPKAAADYKDVKIDLSTAMVEGIYTFMQYPGDVFNFNIMIQNESGIDYAYKEKSYFLTDPDMDKSVSPNTWDIRSFDGELIAENMVPHRLPTSEAIYKGLYGYKSFKDVTGKQMATIDEALAAKGYTGDDALAKFTIDYYNKVDGTSAKEIRELKPATLFTIFSNGVSNVWFPLSKEEYAALSDKQKSHLMRKPKDDDSYQVIEYDKELAEYYYNYFYDMCVGVVMGKTVTNKDANGGTLDPEAANTRTVGYSSVLKIYKNINGERDKQDRYIAEALNDESLRNGHTGTMIAGYVLDGPMTGNNAQEYDFGFKSGILLEKAISSGSVTVNKTLNMNGYTYNDKPTFLFKLTDVNQHVYYKAMSFQEGQTSQAVTFENIPLGEYTVEEIDAIRYELTGETVKKGTLTKTDPNQSVSFTNQKVKDNDFSDSGVVVNSFKKSDAGYEIDQNYQGTQE